MRRQEDERYWLYQAEQKIRTAISVFVDDARMDNERELLLEHGFRFVRLAPNPGAPLLTEQQAEHSSEQDWKSWPADLELPFEPGPDQQADKILKHYAKEPKAWNTAPYIQLLSDSSELS